MVINSKVTYTCNIENHLVILKSCQVNLHFRIHGEIVIRKTSNIQYAGELFLQEEEDC